MQFVQSFSPSRASFRARLAAVASLAIAAAIALTACGGSKTQTANKPPEQSAPRRPAPPADTRPVIVAFGDSLTAGFGAEPGQSYPDFLQKELDRAGLAWRVANEGVSGDTTTDALNRLSEVLADNPRVAIVEFGGNDGLRGLPVEASRSNLQQIVVALRNARVTVVLAGMTLPPNYGPEYIRSFEKIYVDLAEKYKLVRIPFLLQGVATQRGLMQRDGLHPTGKGNEIVAATVFKYVRPMLR